MIDCTKEAKKNAVAIAKGSMTYEQATSSMKQMTLGAKAANVAMKALSVAGNMIAFAVIAKGISLAIKGIDSLIHAQENAIEKADEAISKFNEQREALSSNKKIIDEISSDYENLSKRVDSLGRNISLNTEEYNRYNDIVNQIADMFPQMVQGYTDEGNAIIAHKGNVDELTKAYQEQKKAAQDAIIVQSADVFKGFKAKVDKDAFVSFQETGLIQLKSLATYLSSIINDEEQVSKFLNNLSNMEYEFNYVQLNDLLKNAGYDFGYNDYDEGLEKVKEDGAAKLGSYLSMITTQIEAETAKIRPIMQAYLENSFSYQGLDSDIQDVVKQIVQQFDGEFYSQFDDEVEIANWIEENIVSKFKKADGQELAKQFQLTLDLQTDFNNDKISVAEYQEKLNAFLDIIDELDPETQKAIKLVFGIETYGDGTTTSDVDTMVNNIKEKLNDEFDDKVGELSLGDLEIANKLAIPEGTLLSWDELITKIKETKPALANATTTIDELNSQLDSIQSAYSAVSGAINEYNETGVLSVDTYQALMSVEPEYLNCLMDEKGNLNLTTEALNNLTNARIDEIAVKQASTLIDNVTKLSSETAQKNFLKGATDDLTTSTWALVDAQIAEAYNSGKISADVAQDLTDKTNAIKAWAEAAKKGVGAGLDKDGTADNIKDTQKQLDDLAKSEALEKIKNKFDAIELSIENVNNAITALDNISDLTNENDFIGKIEITSKQLELAQEKTKLLADEFAQLREEEYNSGDQASELASRMKSVTDNINENQKKIIEYGKNITSYYTSALTSISSLSKDNLSKATELIDRNIKTLSEGGLTGLQFTLTPTVPQSAIAKQRKENQTLLDEMNAYYAETAEMQKTALDLQYQEQVADNARKREDLLKTLNEQKDAISEYTIFAKQEQTKFNADTSAKQETDFANKLQESQNFVNNIKTVFGNLINWFKNNPISPTVEMPNGSKLLDVGAAVGVGTEGQITRGISIAQTAKQYLGTPYVWGGESPEEGGFDCSGLMQYVYKQNGIQINRTAAEQFQQGLAVTSMQKLQPGDLVFFGKNGQATHVGMYIGDGKMIHSPTTGEVVQETELFNSRYWTNQYLGARRMYAKGTQDFDVFGKNINGEAGENYKEEILINKKTGKMTVIDKPTFIDTNEYDVVGEDTTAKILPKYATGTPISDPKVLAMIKAASEQTGVPANVLLSLIDQESGGKWVGKVPDGKGYSYGYMQLYDHGALTSIPENRRQAAMSDPATNILEGAKYLKQMYDSVGTGNWGDAASAYNQGLGGFRKNGRNTYGNQVMDRATSTAFIEAGKQLGNISTTITSIQKDTSTIAQIDFKSQLKALTYGSDNTKSENTIEYQGNMLQYIKENTNLGEVSSNELLVSWEKLQNYQNEASKLFGEYGNQLTENRWSDNFSTMRSDVANATNEYTDGIMETSTDVTVQGIVKAFTQGKNILDTLLKYYNERKDAGANADELQTIIDAYTEQSDTVNELSDQYVEAIGSLTEYRKSQAENEMKGFENQLSWQEKTGENIQRQLNASESLSQQASLREMLVQNEASKIGIYQHQKNTAHQSVLDLREEEKFKPILDQFDIETWFDAEGNASAQYNNDIERMSINEDTAKLVPIMKQLFELVSVYKQSWYEADQNIQDVKENLKDVVSANFEAEQELIQKKIDDNDWTISMLSDTSFDLKSKEYSKQLNNHFDMIKKIEKEQAKLDSLYEQGLLVYDDYIELSEELKSNIQNQLSSVKSILGEVYQIQLDKIDDQINDIQESSEKITDELQDQINKLNEEKDDLDELQNKWEQAISAVKQHLDDEKDLLNDNKETAQDYWDDRIDAIKKANEETNKNIDLNKALGDVEKAKSQKISFIYQNGKFDYMTNQAEVTGAQQNYDDKVREFEQEKAIEILEEQRDLEIKSYEDRIQILDDYLEKWNEVTEKRTKDKNDEMALELLGTNYREDLANRDVSILNYVSNEYYRNEAKIEGYINKRIEKLEKQIKAEEETTEETVKNLEKQADAVKKTENQFNELYETIVTMFNSGNVDGIPSVIKEFCDNFGSYFEGLDATALGDAIKNTVSNALEEGIGSGINGVNSSTTSVKDKSKAQSYIEKINALKSGVKDGSIAGEDYSSLVTDLKKEYGVKWIAVGDSGYDSVGGYRVAKNSNGFYRIDDSDSYTGDSANTSGDGGSYDVDGNVTKLPNGDLTQAEDDVDTSEKKKNQAKKYLEQWVSKNPDNRYGAVNTIYSDVITAFSALQSKLEKYASVGFIYKVGDAYHVAKFQQGDSNHSTAIKDFYAKGTDYAEKGLSVINDDGNGNRTYFGELVNFRGGEQVIPADKSIKLIEGLQKVTDDSNPFYSALMKGNLFNLNMNNFIPKVNNLSYLPNLNNQPREENFVIENIVVNEADNAKELIADVRRQLPNLKAQLKSIKK